ACDPGRGRRRHAADAPRPRPGRPARRRAHPAPRRAAAGVGAGPAGRGRRHRPVPARRLPRRAGLPVPVVRPGGPPVIAREFVDMLDRVGAVARVIEVPEPDRPSVIQAITRLEIDLDALADRLTRGDGRINGTPRPLPPPKPAPPPKPSTPPPGKGGR